MVQLSRRCLIIFLQASRESSRDCPAVTVSGGTDLCCHCKWADTVVPYSSNYRRVLVGTLQGSLTRCAGGLLVSDQQPQGPLFLHAGG